MKKVLSALIAVVMSLAFVTVLVSCGKGNDEEDPNKIESDSEITKSEWEKACDIENFKKNVKITANYLEEDTSEDESGTAKFNVSVCIGDGAARFTGTSAFTGGYAESSLYQDTPATADFYMSFDGKKVGDNYIVKDENDKWINSEDDYSDYLIGYAAIGELDDMQYSFDMFEYNEKDGGYVIAKTKVNTLSKSQTVRLERLFIPTITKRATKKPFLMCSVMKNKT